MADPYAIEPDPTPPDLPGETVVREHEDLVLDTLAADVYLQAISCVRTFGDFHLAIAPGLFQERLCLRLMTDPAVRMLPWNRTHVWATSDRAGPGGGARFESIIDLLADHSGIPPGQIHAPEASGPGSAEVYEARLQQALAWREKGQDRLDAAVLSLAPGGRIAGFEHGAGQGGRLVVPINPTPGEISGPGLTMTTRLLNATRLITIIATGDGLRQSVLDVQTGGIRGATEPLRPVGGTIRWYLDRAAYPG